MKQKEILYENIGGNKRTVVIHVTETRPFREKGVEMVEYKWEKQDRYLSDGVSTIPVEQFKRKYIKHEG